MISHEVLAGANEEPADATPEELRRCIRDLVGLLALPAMWRDRDTEGIFLSLLEAIDASLPIAAAHVRIRVDGTAIDLLKADGQLVDASAPEWREFAEAHAAVASRPRELHTPIGILAVAYVPLGFHGIRGGIVFGSRRADFPTMIDTVVLRAGAALADSTAETARVLEERARANQTKDEFLALLGHELRNPLAPIVTAVQLMRMRGGDAVPRELGVIDRQVKHLLRLVDDLLDVARVTRGKIELKREPAEINQILAKALETASPWLDRAGHRLQMDVDPHVVVDADPGRMSQVFANLLTNAAKYTPSGGDIRVTVRKERSSVLITVSDTGIGIPLELQPRIFEMFVQAPRSKARGEGGLGIGLALVKNLVQLHGGHVAVASAGANQGSTFMVSLPLALSIAHSRREIEPSCDLALAGCRILLVDDNVDAATLLAEILDARGATVTLAHDGVTAVNSAAELPPHIALLDIGLPVMDGYEVAEALRSRLGAAAPHMFALTGYGQDADRELSRAARFSGHFVKPVDPEALIGVLRQKLGAARE